VAHSKFDRLFMPTLAGFIGLYLAIFVYYVGATPLRRHTSICWGGSRVTINTGAQTTGGTTCGCLTMSTGPYGRRSSCSPTSDSAMAPSALFYVRLRLLPADYRRIALGDLARGADRSSRADTKSRGKRKGKATVNLHFPTSRQDNVKNSLVGPYAVACPGYRSASDAGRHLLCPRPVRKQHDDVARGPAAPGILDFLVAVLITPLHHHLHGAGRRAYHVQ